MSTTKSSKTLRRIPRVKSCFIAAPLATDLTVVKAVLLERGRQTPPEQRRLLKLLVEKATWKHGELETTLRPPFQKLRVSNHATTTKQGKNGNGGTEIRNWLGR